MVNVRGRCKADPIVECPSIRKGGGHVTLLHGQQFFLCLLSQGRFQAPNKVQQRYRLVVANVEYPVVKKVLDILQDYNVSRFSLITNLEAVKVEVAAEEAKK